MFKRLILVVCLLAVFAGGFAVRPAAAQDEETLIVCDDATLMLLLIAEINGYSQNETSLFPPMDLTQFDLGENQPFFELVIPVLADDEMEPLTDDIISNDLLPLIQEIQGQSGELTPTEQGDIVDENPACKELRESVTQYMAASLLRSYLDEQE